MRKLDHPNIVRLYKVFEDSESISLLMEYVPYGNLYKRVQMRMQFNERDMVLFTRNLMDVLNYLHSKGIIHRDLKLENILMTSKYNDFEFKIADFGLACYLNTMNKTCSGSPGYMAPEILKGVSYGIKADIFSAGVVIYIALSGSSPFRANNINGIIEKNLRCKIKFDRFDQTKVSAAAVYFLQDLLNPDPRLRPTAFEALGSNWVKLRKYSDSETTSTTVKFESIREKNNGNFSKAAEKYVIKL
jgi:calcium/calmodulin-dependent protein kinase I